MSFLFLRKNNYMQQNAELCGKTNLAPPAFQWIFNSLYSRVAEWHHALSSKGVTANFFTLCREKMRHAGG